MSTIRDHAYPNTVAAIDLHDTAWTARGYRVIRRGAQTACRGRGPFLLVEPVDLVDFDPADLDASPTTRVNIVEIATVYEERVVADSSDRLVRVTRDYVAPADRNHDVFVTSNTRLACAWADSTGSRAGRWAMRRAARRLRFPRRTCPGRLRDAADPRQAKCFVGHIGDGLDGDVMPWPRPAPSRMPRGKRLFDILFASAALVATAPIMPLILLAIWFEDGWPVLFSHLRQTRGGRNFTCYKLRTMCREAEKLKPRLTHANVCDGPQFFVRNDPRLLRIGNFLRRFHLDELPQFYNVLRGDMSVVGPRPSPDCENRYCPAWREARLSVRPGITGLWQVRRTREPQTDFHEWIRYDLEYVRHPSWRMDLWILWETVRCLVGRRRSRDEMSKTAVFRFPDEQRYKRAA